MLIPVCSERLPVRMQLTVLSAHGLPVMNRSINSTDAFVEFRFGEESEKTEVVTSLNPVWNASPFTFETDERELCAEVVELRIMDHDTYSANDAIGRVEVDCNVIVESMRRMGEMKVKQNITLPIWDTMQGLQGTVDITVQVELLCVMDHDNYVQFFTGEKLPDELKLNEIMGLVSTMRVEKDPEAKWIDRIRTARATNETRQCNMREAMRAAAVEIAEKARKISANVILSYMEHLDIEGAPSDCYTWRAYGTAVSALPSVNEASPFVPTISFPILTISSLPNEWMWGSGPLVSARTTLPMDDEDDLEARRKGGWTELRQEILQQARTMKCNTVLAYSEQATFYDGVGLLTCFGTAVKFGEVLEEEVEEEEMAMADMQAKTKPHEGDPNLPCAIYHSAYKATSVSPEMKLFRCSWCGNEECCDLILSTAKSPIASLILGTKTAVQVTISRRVTVGEDEEEGGMAAALTTMLPNAERDLFNLFITEGKAVHNQANSFFEIRQTTQLAENVLVCVLTGVAVRVACLQRDEHVSRSLAAISSIASINKTDMRRFSWGAVKDALRGGKNAHPQTVTLKVLNVRRNVVMNDEDGPKKRSRRLDSIVSIIKKKPHPEKEQFDHAVLERVVSCNIGIVSPGSSLNTSHVAGIHLGAPLVPLALSDEQAQDASVMGRWRQIYIREDNSGIVRDSASLDIFLKTVFDECLTLSRGALSSTPANSFSNCAISSCIVTADRDGAQCILLITADLVVKCI